MKRSLVRTVKIFVLAVMTAGAIILIAPNAYMRMGTDVIGEFRSPNGKSDAILMVKNGGAMSDFSTHVSIVKTGFIARQVALFRPANTFVADDNNGAIPVGKKGQIDVKIRWKSEDELLVTYPQNAQVFLRAAIIDSIHIEYQTTK